MKYRIAAIAALAMLAATATAEARHHRSHHRHIIRTPIVAPAVASNAFYDNDGHITIAGPIQGTTGHPSASYYNTAYAIDNGRIVGGRPRGCPRAFCGCAASIRVFGKIIPYLNLAANWLRFPRTAPAPGMVAARNNHVFVIEAVNGDGSVVAYDGNSGHHLTRIHTVSLRGFHVVNPHAGSGKLAAL